MLERPYDGCGKCFIGLRRLSRKSDATTSPERQRDHVLTTADSLGGHIIAWADDWEVSGATDPLTRPAFGPWLKGEMGPYNGIVGSAVDRIGRNVRDVLNTAWAIHDQGRILATYGHDGPWDLDDPVDESRLTMEAFGSQMELRSIQRRNRDTTIKQRAAGKPKGKPGYGYRFVRHTPKGPVVEVALHEHAAGIRRGLAHRVLSDGTGLITPNSEAARLNRAGELSPKDHLRVMYGKEPLGTPWLGSTVRLLLRSPAALGYLMHKSKPVVGADGHPVQIGPPMWDLATHHALIAKTDHTDRPRKQQAPAGDYLLIGLSECGTCGYRLYTGGKTDDRIYICLARIKGLPGAESCSPAPGIRMRYLDPAVEADFLAEFGNVEIFHTVYDAGSGQPARIRELEASRERLRQDRQAGLYDSADDAAWFREQYARMGQEMEELKGQEIRLPGMRRIPTGRRVRDDWMADESPTTRRELLASYGAKVRLFPADAPKRYVITYEYEGDPGVVSDDD